MAWPKDKRKLIEFVENRNGLLIEVKGYLKAQTERYAIEYATRIEDSLKEWQDLRQSMYVQLDFWDEEPKKRGKAGG